MFNNFAQIENFISSMKLKKIIALAGSNDSDALTSVVTAKRKGLVDAVLIGDVSKTKDILKDLGEPAEDYLFIEEPNGRAAAQTACTLISKRQADIPMKGNLSTADFMRAVLDKTYGFIPDKGLLCQATVLEYTYENRLIIISDCAINVAPDFASKMKITENAVFLAHKLLNECPKVAVVAPIELVNTEMQSTVDAALLSKAAQRGQISGCIIDGPLALDNAVCLEAAQSKGIKSDVAGLADILIMPDLASGNILTKSLHYFARLKQSGTITGAKIPVVMTSRTDTADDKYYSILISVLQSF